MTAEKHRLSLSEIKAAELEMLKEFKRVCEENHLYYTLCGGTLLGAIRHKGFIPWDDDIDVLMPRPDFERLGQLIREQRINLPSHLKACSWFSVPMLRCPFYKLLDFRTTVEDCYSTADTHLWIDIFPIDGCVEPGKELNRFYRKVMLRRKLLLLRNAKIGEGKTKAAKLLKPLLVAPLRLIPVEKMCESYDRMVQRWPFETAPKAAGISWGYGPQECINKEAWLTPIQVEFEGEIFNAPSNYHEYLSHLYGDYMQLPPVEERNTRHEMIVYMQTTKGTQ